MTQVDEIPRRLKNLVDLIVEAKEDLSDEDFGALLEVAAEHLVKARSAILLDEKLTGAEHPPGAERTQ